MDISNNNTVFDRENLVKESADVLASVQRGLRQSASNDTVDLGDFSVYAATGEAV